jgi:hypothetical protein
VLSGWLSSTSIGFGKPASAGSSWTISSGTMSSGCFFTYTSLLPVIRLIACDSVSTALMAREYFIRVGPITPTAPVLPPPE